MKVLLIGHTGYVGSYLVPRLNRLPSVDLNTLSRSCGGDYHNLSQTLLQGYDIVLWFAGHSSVPKAVNDPLGALDNNVFRLVELRRKMRPDARLIYASSIAVYAGCRHMGGALNEQSDVAPSTSAYDVSKWTMDYIAQRFLWSTIGLRLGTVSGWSPKIRPEMVFNAMNLSAMRNGHINLANPNVTRTLVWLDDIWRMVKILLEKGPDDTVKMLNVGSWSGTMLEMATAIASHHKVAIIEQPSTSGYSFHMDCTKMYDLIERSDSIDVQIEKFAEHVKHAESWT